VADKDQGQAVTGPLSIAICCDNTPSAPEFASEWGFAAAIGLPNGNLWLFDSGKSDILVNNCRMMGIDFLSARGLILSHGHYDHAGGIPALLKTGFNGQILGHPGCTRSRYRIKQGGKPTPIGIPEEVLVLSRERIRPIPVDGRIDRGLRALSPISRKPGLFQATRYFFLDPEGTRPDLVEDDLALLLDSGQGPVLLLGCCHSGLANTLYAAKERFGTDSIHAVVGGLHLKGAGPAAVEEAAAVLEEFRVMEIYAGHCTGEQEMLMLADLLPGRVMPLGSGRVLTF
jgi:7,8-dihydropterin-6-yl-methyl-4-(beta-D-ribofuranosyl)aminobenzene 5'-phosphate synthase